MTVLRERQRAAHTGFKSETPCVKDTKVMVLSARMRDSSYFSTGDLALICTVEESLILDGGGKLAATESIDNGNVYFYNRLRS